MATLSVPASLEQLANVNAFIHETIPSSYRPLIPQVELAAEELLVNVFSYAYPDVPGEAQVARASRRPIRKPLAAASLHPY